MGYFYKLHEGVHAALLSLVPLDDLAGLPHHLLLAVFEESLPGFVHLCDAIRRLGFGDHSSLEALIVSQSQCIGNNL